MSDENEVDIVVEADASAVVSSTEQAISAFGKMLDQVKNLESGLAHIFTQQLPMGVQQLKSMADALREIERIPTLPQSVVARNQAGGGRLSNQEFSRVLRDLRADPAMQGLKYEQELNKQLEAREQLYRRVAAAMPGATEDQRLTGYRQALSRLGVNAPSITGTKAERDAARAQRQAFLQETEQQTRLFNEKISAEYLAEEAKKYEKANLLYEQMMRKRAGMMTPEEAQAKANRISGYAAQRGQTVDTNRLIAAYEDEHARQFALNGPPTAPAKQTMEDMVKRRVAMRDAQLNYMGGAPMFGVEAHTMANYALMGAAIGGIGYAGKSVIDFQNGLEGIKSEAGATDTAMSQLAKDIMAVGASSSQSLTDLTAATETLVKAGYGVQQAGQMLKPVSQLATATKSTAKDTADVIMEVMKTFSMASSDTPMVANALAEIATKSKVSLADVGAAFKSAGQFAQGSGMQFNEVLASFGAMAAAGMKDGSQLGSGLRSLIEALDNPTQKLQAQLAKVGLTAADVNVQAHGLGGALEAMKDHEFTASEAMAGFQARAFQAYNALSQNIGVFNAFDQSLLSSTAAVDGATQRMDSLDAQWQHFLNTLTKAAYQAVKPLLDALTLTVKGLASLLDVASKLGPVLAVLGTVLGAMAAASVLVWVGKLVAGFVEWSGVTKAMQVTLAALTIETVTFETVMTAGVAAVKAFTVALLATPVGWITAGIAGISLGLELLATVQNGAARQVEDYGKKVDEANGKQTEYKSRISELDQFIGSLIERHDALANNTNLAGQAAQTAAQRFAAWGLEITAQTKNVDGLIDKLIELRRQQAGQALDAAKTSNAALAGQNRGLDTEIGNKLWGITHDQGLGFGVIRGNVASILNNLTPGNVRDSLAKLRAAGAPQNILDRVEGVARLVNQREGNNFQIQANNQTITSNTAASSPQFAEFQKRLTALNIAQRNAELSAIQVKDPVERAKAIQAAAQAGNERYALGQKMASEFADSIARDPQAGGRESVLATLTGSDAWAQLRNTSLTSEPTDQKGWQARASRLRTLAAIAKRQGNKGQYQSLMEQATHADLEAKASSANFNPLSDDLDEIKAADDAKTQLGLTDRHKDKTTEILKDQAKHLKDQIDHMVGIGATPADIEALQPQLKSLLAQWADKSRAAIRNEGGDDMAAKLQNFEDTNREYVNKILEGNLAAAQQIIADASKKSATDRGKGLAAAARNGSVTSLDDAIAGIQAAYAQAISDQADYLKTKYLKDHPGASGLELSAKTADDIQKATDSLGEAAAKAIVAVIDGAAEASLRSARLSAQQTQREIEGRRVSISAARNSWGSRNISDAHNFVLDRQGQQLDIQEALNQQALAHAEAGAAAGQISSLRAQLANTSNETQRGTILDALTKATQQYEKLQDAEAKADQTVQRLTEHTQPLATFGQSLNAAWAQFSEEAKIGQPFFERMADSLHNTLQATHQGFQNFFRDIATGTTTAGNAFRNLGIAIFSSLADAASKALADQAIQMLFNMLGVHVNPLQQLGGGPSISANPSNPIGQLSTDIHLWQGGYVRRAVGGYMTGGVPNRDSIPTLLAPGEFVMNQDAVSTIGRDTLENLNSAGNAMRATPTLAQAIPPRKPDQVNVWLTQQDEKPQLGPKDVVHIIGQDILTSGQTKKLIQAVQLGAA